MSADNAYFVIHSPTALTPYSVAHGFMSGMEDEGDYKRQLFIKGKKFESRADALVYAHDMVKEDYIVEYGVCEIELSDK